MPNEQIKMEDIKARKQLLSAVQNFVAELAVCFSPKRQTPMGRYHRFLKKLMVRDTETLDRIFKGFETFFEDYDNLYLEIEEAAIIPYKETMYIPIGHLLNSEQGKSDKTSIINHLEAIKRLLGSVVIKTKIDKLATKLNLELALCESASNEDLVVDQVLDLITTLITEMKNASAKTPEGEEKPGGIMDIASNILKSQSMTETFESIQGKIKNEEVDGQKLLGKLGKAIPQLVSKLMMSLGESSDGNQIEQQMPEYLKAIQGVMQGITGPMGRH